MRVITYTCSPATYMSDNSIDNTQITPSVNLQAVVLNESTAIDPSVEGDAEDDNYQPSLLTKVGTAIVAPVVYAAMLPLAGLGLAMGWILRHNEQTQMAARHIPPEDARK